MRRRPVLGGSEGLAESRMSVSDYQEILKYSELHETIGTGKSVSHNWKLIEFGLSAKPKGGLDSHLNTCCGSPANAAPELIQGKAYIGSELGHLDEDCVTELSVFHNQSRESMSALMSEEGSWQAHPLKDSIPNRTGQCNTVSKPGESQFTTVTPVEKPRTPTNTYGLTATEILPERRCHAVDLDLNLAHVDSSQRKRKAKLLGGLERGLDKVITVLPPGQKKQFSRHGPRQLKAHCNVTRTQLLNPDRLLNEIISVLSKKGYTLQWQRKPGFGKESLKFE